MRISISRRMYSVCSVIMASGTSMVAFSTAFSTRAFSTATSLFLAARSFSSLTMDSRYSAKVVKSLTSAAKSSSSSGISVTVMPLTFTWNTAALPARFSA